MGDQNTFSFPAEVKLVFSFLEEYGFHCQATSQQKVRYESDTVYLEITHGGWDGEISIAFGRIALKEEFSFTLFLRSVNPSLEKALGERLAFEPDQIISCLKGLGAALLDDGRSILLAEEAVFDRMKDVRWWDFEPDALKKKPE